ncbi:hypothetical protein [Micromonospora maritima]|uniref:hypothetical protein n=1 Tax=Micromonospora maritima TaxID=986711 RepID=UPI00157DBDC8|nr:hypothetical protein [Micromonospora maritima]
MPDAQGQLTAGELAQIYALVQTYTAIREQLTQLAVAGAQAPFRALANWYDTGLITVAALDALRVVQPAQRRMAEVTDAYLARALSTMTGTTHRPIGPVDVTRLRRELTDELADVIDDLDDLEVIPSGEMHLVDFFDDDYPFDDDADWDDEAAWDDGAWEDPAFDEDQDVKRVERPREPVLRERYPEPELADAEPADMVEVYSRVAAEYRYRVSRGEPKAQAKKAALDRAATIAQMDVSLAGREQEYEVFRQVDDREIIGYRRILRPELSKSGTSCGLCVVAADRIYHREHLKEIHANCHCAVLPVRRTADPGLQLNEEDLARLYRAAGSTGGGKRQFGALKYVRVVITEDGELGPIVAEAPESLRRDGGRSRRRGARVAQLERKRGKYRTLTPQERIPGLERHVAELRQRYLAGETNLAGAITYAEKLVDEVRAQLRPETVQL